MKRRDFLAGVAAVGTSTGCAPSPQEGPAVHTTKRVQWRLVSSFPRSLDTIFGPAEVLADTLSKMTDGAFNIRVHPAGEVVPGLQVLDAVQQGTAQVGQSASYYYTGKDQALSFDTGLPFGMSARQQTAWLEEGGGRELVDSVFADFGVKSFTGGNTGAQMGGWFNREISSVADLQGLKMRVPGMGGAVMSALGASVQLIAGGEIYTALERGAIDATEWIGPYDDENLGFHKVAKHYYYPGWWEPGPSLSFYVNQKAWSSLPTHFQAAFSAASKVAAASMQERYDARNPQALQRLLKFGVKPQPFSDELMRAARAATEEIVQGYCDADPRYKKIYESWNKARVESGQWFGLAELAYGTFAWG